MKEKVWREKDNENLALRQSKSSILMERQIQQNQGEAKREKEREKLDVDSKEERKG